MFPREYSGMIAKETKSLKIPNRVHDKLKDCTGLVYGFSTPAKVIEALIDYYQESKNVSTK